MTAAKEQSIVILGIDPGIAKLGYGCVRNSKNALTYITSGVFTSSPSTAPEKRLAGLWKDLTLLYKNVRPDRVVVERLFPAPNTTLHRVNEVRGMILLLCGLQNIPVEEVSPRALKSVTTRFGGAPKLQMRRTVQRLLDMPSPPPADAADALALAILGSARHLGIAKS